MTPEESRVLDYYEHPYNKQIPEMAESTFLWSIRGEATNDTCGDHIRWWGQYNFERCIIDICWYGEGCCFSQAAASMLAEQCGARLIYEVRAFTQDDMLALFGVDVEPGRIECVMVAYRALMKALEKYDE